MTRGDGLDVGLGLTHVMDESDTEREPRVERALRSALKYVPVFIESWWGGCSCRANILLFPSTGNPSLALHGCLVGCGTGYLHFASCSFHSFTWDFVKSFLFFPCLKTNKRPSSSPAAAALLSAKSCCICF